MTGRATPGIVFRRRTGIHGDWVHQARCTPSHAWTSDKKPTLDVLAAMMEVCDSCPVLAECAAYALDEGLSGGMYAGVWVPSAKKRRYFALARERLHELRTPCTSSAN